MAAHSGDVLVDSLNLSAAEGSSSDAAQNGDKAGGDSTADKDAAGAASGEKTETVTSDDASSVAGSDEFFKEARETLAYDRNEMISVLTDTIDNAGEGSEKNSAKEQKDKIIKYMDLSLIHIWAHFNRISGRMRRCRRIRRRFFAGEKKNAVLGRK